MAKSAVLTLVGVTKSFARVDGHSHILKKVDGIFKQGKTYALTGVSGTGKSTLVQVLTGLDAPDGGQIMFDEKDIYTLTDEEQFWFRTEVMGLVFQLPYLIRELSVEENVMVPGLIRALKEDLCRSRAHELLSHVGLKGFALEKPATLSGGQQQRLAIARALFNKPAFLVADEPTGNLDGAAGAAIVALLLSLQKTDGMGIVISTHDMDIAHQMDHIYELKDGKLVLIK